MRDRSRQVVLIKQDLPELIMCVGVIGIGLQDRFESRKRSIGLRLEKVGVTEIVFRFAVIGRESQLGLEFSACVSRTRSMQHSQPSKEMRTPQLRNLCCHLLT